MVGSASGLRWLQGKQPSTVGADDGLACGRWLREVAEGANVRDGPRQAWNGRFAGLMGLAPPRRHGAQPRLLSALRASPAAASARDRAGPGRGQVGVGGTVSSIGEARQPLRQLRSIAFRPADPCCPRPATSLLPGLDFRRDRLRGKIGRLR